LPDGNDGLEKSLNGFLGDDLGDIEVVFHRNPEIHSLNFQKSYRHNLTGS
jgi:hypothetical protein